MTTPAIWWYPQGSPLKRVSLSQDLSEIVESEEVADAESESISGRAVRIVYNTRRLVRVVSELVTDQDDTLEMRALINHLRAGGYCAVAEDRDKAFGAFARSFPQRGATSLRLYDNLYANFSSGWTPSADEVLYLRGPSPRGLQEPVVCDGTGSASFVGLSTSPRHDWSAQRWCLVTNQRFWPVLRLQSGRRNDPLLISERRVHYTLDLPLEESPWAFERIAEAPDLQLGGETFEEGVPGLDGRLKGVFTGYSSGRDTPGPSSGPMGSGGGWY